MIVTELQVVNAIFGFCVPSANTWPTPFADHGYKVSGIEREVSTFVGGSSVTVVPDITCSSDRLHHVAVVDAKSRTVDGRQAQAYASLESRQLFTQGSVIGSVDPARLTHDSIFTTSEQHSHDLKSDLDRTGVSLPIVAANNHEFLIAYGRIKKLDLDNLFRDGIQINKEDWPMHYVKFRADSEFSEMAAAVVSAMVQCLIHTGWFSIDDIVSRTVDHWKLCGNKEQKRFRRRITQLIGLAVQEEFHDYVHRPDRCRRWESTRKSGPLSHPKQIDALQNRAANFVYRIQNSIPYRKDQPLLLAPELFDVE